MYRIRHPFLEWCSFLLCALVIFLLLQILVLMGERRPARLSLSLSLYGDKNDVCVLVLRICSATVADHRTMRCAFFDRSWARRGMIDTVRAVVVAGVSGG